jgi:hypothetical protein
MYVLQTMALKLKTRNSTFFFAKKLVILFVITAVIVSKNIK